MTMDLTVEPALTAAEWTETTTIEVADLETQLAEVVQHILSRMAESDSRKRAFDITVPGSREQVILFHAELCNRLRERGLYAWHREQGLVVAFPPQVVTPDAAAV